MPTTAAGAGGPDGTRVMSRQTEVLVEEEEPERPSRTSTYFVILAVLLAVLGLLLFLLARELGVGGASEVLVPTVVGDNQETATRKLRDADLRVRVRQEPNEANQVGRVISQNPTAGARVDKGSTVEITVAAAPEPVEVPNVVNRNVEDARDVLDERGFAVSTSDRPDERAARGVVVQQDPAGGARAPRGSTVNLVVSSGRPLVEVPPLANVPEAEAAARLEQLGFSVERTTRSDSDVASGRVIRTDPTAGTSLERGSTVTLVVSSGPAPTAPPTTSPPATTRPTLPPTTTATTTTARQNTTTSSM